MLLKVEMDKYITGKRSKKKYTKNFNVSNDLWKALCNFAAEDPLSVRGKYDWNNNTLYLVRSNELLSLLKRECKSQSERSFYLDAKREMFGANIIVEKAFVDRTFSKTVAKIDSFGFAYFLNNTKDGMYKVKISDQLRSQLEVGDLAEIAVLANEKWIVIDRVAEDDSLDVQQQNFDQMLGGY